MTPPARGEEENFAVTLTDQCKTHAAWLAVVLFGLGTLLENQPLLIEVITREAERECDRFNSSIQGASHHPSDHVRNILGELGLRLVVG